MMHEVFNVVVVCVFWPGVCVVNADGVYVWIWNHP